MRNFVSLLSVALVAFALAYICVAPSYATADERRIAGTGSCSGWNISNNTAGASINGSYVVLASTGLTLVGCSTPSDTALRHTDATDLVVSGWTAAARTFYACVSSPTGYGTSCGPGTATAAGGNYAVHPNRSVWNNATYAGWAPYVTVNLEYSDRVSAIIFHD